MGRGQGQSDAYRRKYVPTDEQKAECREKIRDDLADLAREEANLLYAKTQFDPFDLTTWKTVFRGIPEDAFTAGGVNWPAATMVNDLNGVLMSGTVLDGLMPWSQLKQNAPGHYNVLAKAEVISARSKEDLLEANTIRKMMTHFYSNATAEDVFELVKMLETLVPRLRHELGPWLTRLGVV